jgi:hypothetical protein
MTPTPPSTPDGSNLPARHRPTLGNLAKDTTEMDLWDFEDDLELSEHEEEPRAEEIQRPPSRDIPAPRERQGGKPRETEERSVPKTPTGGEDRIRMNVNKVRGTSRPSGPVTGQSKPESDFDELEHWEDARVSPEIEDLPVETEPDLFEPISLPKVIPTLKPMPVAPEEVEKTAPVIKEEADDEFSPVIRENATPVSLRPHLGLSNMERIGMIALAALLVVGALAVLIFSINRLPTEPEKAEANDFPIQGSHLSITSATSYWRAPITEGAAPDTFRRETQLLPVLEIGVSGGPAVLRILFRNDERAVIGDAVTRAVRSGGTLKIPATAGFDEVGMHAAYRTGGTKPWTIEVYEAPSAETAGKDFKKLFEMNISSDRR